MIMFSKRRRSTDIALSKFVLVLIFSTLGVGCSSQIKNYQNHQFKLVGGHFYGPGPIAPDTALPVGYLHNIRFDEKHFSGYAQFTNDGSENALLSDGKTQINQNIEAGVLDIGGGSNPVTLVAVKGGPNNGREYYSLGDDYSLNWKVDLALDPGFAEGIISMDNFRLTTGLIKIAYSVQTDKDIPGGYDQAGSLKSGQYLTGRVGDFDQNGFMDGIVVAAPRVPIESAMLPGSPVGNQRGFETDIPLPAHLASELTLRGIAQFEAPLDELISSGDVDEVIKLLKDIRLRINATQRNMDRALIGGPWSPSDIKAEGFAITDRLQTLTTLNFITLSMIEHYPTYGGKFSNSIVDSMGKMFGQLHKLIDEVSKINKKTEQQLPHKKAAKSV